jgi:hypothetical protein
MSGPCCDNCVYCVCDPEAWQRSLCLGEQIVPRCANHPQWPGVACRNYLPKTAPPEGEDVRLIPLSGGGYAWVDADDYEWLSRYHWHTTGGYPSRREQGKEIAMHREIMQPRAGKVVDHADGNRQNECRSNLRRCTPGENRRNTHKRRNGYSRFKGVTFQKSLGKWKAHYKFKGRSHHIGCFDDEAEAARAYDAAAVKHFGEFACVNFPREWPPERRAQVYAERLQAGAAQGHKTEDARRRSSASRRSRSPSTSTPTASCTSRPKSPARTSNSRRREMT